MTGTLSVKTGKAIDTVTTVNLYSMETTETNTATCAACDVPTHLHGTACGWDTATWLMYPVNQQQNEWSRKWIDAHPGSYPIYRTAAAVS